MRKDCSITFFYYQDIFSIVPFYEKTLGLELVLDQGMARIYRIGGQSYFGIVDGKKGHLHHQPKSAALLTIISQDVKQWHQNLKAQGVKGLSEVLTGTFCEHFFFEDPAGYAIEIQRFHNPEVAKLFA